MTRKKIADLVDAALPATPLSGPPLPRAFGIGWPGAMGRWATAKSITPYGIPPHIDLSKGVGVLWKVDHKTAQAFTDIYTFISGEPKSYI